MSAARRVAPPPPFSPGTRKTAGFSRTSASKAVPLREGAKVERETLSSPTSKAGVSPIFSPARVAVEPSNAKAAAARRSPADTSNSRRSRARVPRTGTSWPTRSATVSRVSMRTRVAHAPPCGSRARVKSTGSGPLAPLRLPDPGIRTPGARLPSLPRTTSNSNPFTEIPERPGILERRPGASDRSVPSERQGDPAAAPGAKERIATPFTGKVVPPRASARSKEPSIEKPPPPWERWRGTAPAVRSPPRRGGRSAGIVKDSEAPSRFPPEGVEPPRTAFSASAPRVPVSGRTAGPAPRASTSREVRTEGERRSRPVTRLTPCFRGSAPPDREPWTAASTAGGRSPDGTELSAVATISTGVSKAASPSTCQSPRTSAASTAFPSGERKTWTVRWMASRVAAYPAPSFTRLRIPRARVAGLPSRRRRISSSS